MREADAGLAIVPHARIVRAARPNRLRHLNKCLYGLIAIHPVSPSEVACYATHWDVPLIDSLS